MASPGDKSIYANINTIRNTQWSLNTWNEWRAGINIKLQDGEKEIPTLDELPMLPFSEVDELLTKFIGACQTPEGNEYPPDSIRNIVYGIQRHIRLTIPDINFFEKQTKNFVKFQDAYNRKVKELNAKGISAKKRQAQAVSQELEKTLWDKGAFRFHNAMALSNAVFFYTSKIFGLIAGESLRKLDTKHLKFGEDNKGKYIELDGCFAQTVCCRHYKVGMDPEDGSIRHYQDVDNQRCYYNLMVHYIKQIRKAQLDGPLFLKPLQEKCFSNQALGENNLASKLSQIMRANRVEGYYTNHSIILAVSMTLSSKGISLRKLHGSARDILEICKLMDPPEGVVVETEAILVPITSLSGATATGSYFVQQPGTQFILQQPMPSVSLPLTTGNTIQQALRKKISSKPTTKSIMQNTKAVNLEKQVLSLTKSKKQGKELFPLYLRAADSTSNTPQEGATEEDTTESPEEPQMIIKQEPVDYYDYYDAATANFIAKEIEEFERENSNDTNNSEMSTAISSTDHTSQEMNVHNSRKRKLDQTGTDEAEPESKSPAVSNNTAEVVLSFNKNSENGLLKQEVEVHDNEQEVFTSSSTYKTGRQIPDFDLSLGDFLPENCVIKPNDIQIKRIATVNGGKIVLNVKYSTFVTVNNM